MLGSRFAPRSADSGTVNCGAKLVVLLAPGAADEDWARVKAGARSMHIARHVIIEAITLLGGAAQV